MTLERVAELRKQLEAADREIEAIIRDYYAGDELQSFSGNIGQIARLHSELVEQLAEKERELRKKK